MKRVTKKDKQLLAGYYLQYKIQDLLFRAIKDNGWTVGRLARECGIKKEQLDLLLRDQDERKVSLLLLGKLACALGLEFDVSLKSETRGKVSV
jgi:transcriptional regulator with XRE-family HTH domain